MNQKRFLTISLILFTFLILSQVSLAYSYQTYTYNRASYGNQYNFNYNNIYNHMNPYPKSGAYNYVTGNNYFASRNPVLLGTNKCGTTRCDIRSYTNNRAYSNSPSHLFIRNKETYQYYTHPEMLAPRRMSNNQRWYVGTGNIYIGRNHVPLLFN